MPSVLCLLHHPWLALFWFYQRKTLIRQERNGSLFCSGSVFIVVGSMLKVDLVWTLADFFNGLMVIPNALALLALSGVVASICKKYSSEKSDN